MTKYTRRDWYMLNVGFSACGALIGALTHSMPLVLWNLFWIGYTLYLIGNLEK